MPDLDFNIEAVQAVPYSAVPMLAFKLRVTQPQLDEDASPAPIHSVMLRCQIRIDPARRRYDPAEQSRLSELFGEPHRWGQTVRGMLWTHTTLMLPAFTTETVADLPVPSTYDFNVASTKYFAALADGEIPLSFLFSGTIFYATAEQSLQVEQISWEKEAAFRLPVDVWRKMMDMYYPNTAWLSLRQDVFDRLNAYRLTHAIPTWELAMEALLNGARDTVGDPLLPPPVRRGRVVGEGAWEMLVGERIQSQNQPPPLPSPGVPGEGKGWPPNLSHTLLNDAPDPLLDSEVTQ